MLIALGKIWNVGRRRGCIADLALEATVENRSNGWGYTKSVIVCEVDI